jgi:hypothetical protein
MAGHDPHSFLTMTNVERLDEWPGALLSSLVELLAERKVNRPAALPDPPGQPDAGEEVASTYWYEQALGDLLDKGFLVELEDRSFRVPDLEALLRSRGDH